MINRSILEWATIRYGANADEIPEWAADRIATAAAASPLAKRGDGVVEHGRHGLRARGIVGVIAAEGCTLEILPKIDFPHEDGARAAGKIRRRLVHMLAVALDLRIEAGRLSQFDWQTETLLELLIHLFTAMLADAVRQGLPRRYVAQHADLLSLRGRLDVSQQYSRLAVDASRLACHHDSLSEDIAINRIMKAAVRRLAGLSQRVETQRRLRELDFIYAEVSDISLPSLPWHEISLDRTNARWRGLLDLARMLLLGRFQTTSDGKTPGFSLLFEMSALFEEYVARMLRRALAETDLRVVAQSGRLYCLETQDQRGLFQTRPDILVKRGEAVLQVIDTKWKKIGLQPDDPKQGVSQADVYQMMAYGRLYRCNRLTLVYPHHSLLGTGEGLLQRYRVTSSDDHLEVASVDITHADDILKRLADLTGPLQAATPHCS